MRRLASKDVKLLLRLAQKSWGENLVSRGELKIADSLPVSLRPVQSTEFGFRHTGASFPLFMSFPFLPPFSQCYTHLDPFVFCPLHDHLVVVDVTNLSMVLFPSRMNYSQQSMLGTDQNGSNNAPLYLDKHRWQRLKDICLMYCLAER